METTTQSAESQPVREGFSLWPKQLLGPPPGLKELNLACWGLFLGLVVIPICAVFWIQAKKGTKSTVQLNSDFVLYYGVGRLADQFPASRIYDPALQHQAFMQIFPTPRGVYGVSPYPPFVPLFFSAMAHLSFNVAYFSWMAISLALYCIGIGAASAGCFSGDRFKQSLICCFAFAYYPFLGQDLVNGQLASIAVFAVGLAILEENREHYFRSGLALALMAYKPTLLLLVLPMLLITKRYRQVSGFFAGASALFLIGTAYGGLQAWVAYARLLQYNSRLAGVNGHTALKIWSYLDFSSMSHMIPGGRTPVALAILSAIAVIIAVLLAILLMRSQRMEMPIQWLAWAATLTWTMLLNVYVPIYDSVLVVIAAILTLGALRDLKWGKGAEWTILLALAIFAVSWKTEAFAQAHKIQLLTLALLILGTVQLVFLRRATRRELAA